MDRWPTPTRLQCGPFVADFRACELLKDGERIHLQDKPMRLLAALTVNPGEVVSREDLQKQLWPDDTFVDFETGLNAAVRKLREALADNPENPQYVETIPKHGYRFLAEVRKNGTNGSSADAEKPSPVALTNTSLGKSTIASLVETVAGYGRAKRLWMVVAAALALGGLALVLEQLTVPKVPGPHESVFGTSGASSIRSLAVLPLLNLSADPAQEYFSDGMTDALITELAQMSSLKVISRTSSMQYKQTKKSLPKIARELNVDGIIEGTVQRSGDRVRITARLIQGASDKHLWANSYERDTSDVFALERDITADIARQIRAQLTTQNQLLVAQLWPVNPKVVEAYLQGNHHLHRYSRGSGDEENKEAAEYFQQAIDADPDFAPAYIGMAEAYSNRFWSRQHDTAVMRKAADRAVLLAPNFSDAWATLALSKKRVRDWSGAEADYRKAIDINPNNAGAHDGFCVFLASIGRLDDGRRECQIAQQLDPSNDHLAWILYLQGEYEHSVATAQMMLQSHPDDGYFHHLLYSVYGKEGMYKESIQELEQTATLYGNPKLAANLRRALFISGYRGAMREYAKELEYLYATKQLSMPVNLAEVYATLGDKDSAFYWLEQAYTRRGLITPGADVDFVKVDPMLISLRADPRFTDLLRRIGLPP